MGITPDAVAALKQLGGDAAARNPMGITADALTALKQLGGGGGEGERKVPSRLRAMTVVAMGLVLSRVYLPSGEGIPLWLVFPHCQRMEVKGASVLP